MAENQQNTTDPNSLLTAWIKTASDFWGTMLSQWATDASSGDAGADMFKSGKGRTRESLESVLKTWQTLSAAAGDSGSMDAFSNLSHTMPDVLVKMVQSSWQGMFSLQQKFLERAGRIGESTKAYSFDNLDESTFRAWTEIYEQELSQFLHIPQLGLTRQYQEKTYHAIDRFNKFQAAFTEFMYVFNLPMEKSFKALQEQVGEMADESSLPEHYNDYYRMWIKILEGHYMTLFKSPEYLETMSNTLSTLHSFLSARDALVQDALKSWSIPAQNEMDELYKEIYHLKKRIRKLEKQT